MPMNDILLKLQYWFKQHCDGDWEHQNGIIIDTLDNPGWRVLIYLDETELSSKKFDSLKTDRSDTDWFHCSVSDGKFCGYGGVENLPEILSTFLNWTKSH